MEKSDEIFDVKKYNHISKKLNELTKKMIAHEDYDDNQKKFEFYITEIYFRSKHISNLVEKMLDMKKDEFNEGDLDILLEYLIDLKIEIFDEIMDWMIQLKKPLKDTIDKVEDFSYKVGGFAPLFNDTDGFNHFYGGEHSINGAECPNCNKPLILHLTLDPNDIRLNLKNNKFDQLPLLYCMRCSLSWYDFIYKIKSEKEISIIEAYNGEILKEDWDEAVGGDKFKKRKISLKPVPIEVQSIYDKLNRNHDITENDEVEICKFTGNYADPEVGGYPIVDVSNQIGGIAFLSQKLDDPVCPDCKEEMRFLASLTNDEKNSFIISFDGVQIVFFYCHHCSIIHVKHSM